MTTTRSNSVIASPSGPWGREVSSELILNYAEPRSAALQAFDVLQIIQSEISMPIVDAPPAASWVAEGAEISNTDPTVSEVVVRPSKLAVLSTFSREALQDDTTGSLAAAEVVGGGMAASIDAAMFTTLAAPAPQGLNAITPNLVNANPALGLDGFFAAAAHAVALGTMVDSFVLSPEDWSALSLLKKQDGSNEQLLSDATSTAIMRLAGAQILVCSSVPQGTAWALPRAAARIVVREGIDLVVDTSRFLEFDKTAVRATMRVSFGFVRPATISKIAVVAGE
jgi:HK97 family phage major capsid protein